MKKDDPTYPITRPLTKEDLKNFKYDPNHKCDYCDKMGSYRTTEFYLCEEDILDLIFVEIE